MKILGLGIPELIIIGLLAAPIVAIIVVVVAVSSSNKAQRCPTPINPQAGSPASQQIPPASTAGELKGYKELLDIGAITQEEFDMKKRELLGF